MSRLSFHIRAGIAVVSLLASTGLATESVSMAFSKPTNKTSATVTVSIDPGQDVPVTIPINTSAEKKRDLIRDALVAAGYDVSDNGAGGNQLTIKHLANGTKVAFSPGTTGELKDDVVGKNTKEASVAFEGSFIPFDPNNQPAVFTAGIVTDAGELTAAVSSEELNFQTDGPIICQALFQRLAPLAPHYGAQLSLAGDRLEVYFDPAYTLDSGGISFGTSSLTQGATGGVTVFSWCLSDFNHDGFVNGDDFDAFAEVFEAADPAADLNHDGFVNGDDFDAFAEAFEAGC